MDRGESRIGPPFPRGRKVLRRDLACALYRARRCIHPPSPKPRPRGRHPRGVLDSPHDAFPRGSPPESATASGRWGAHWAREPPLALVGGVRLGCAGDGDLSRLLPLVRLDIIDTYPPGNLVLVR